MKYCKTVLLVIFGITNSFAQDTQINAERGNLWKNFTYDMGNVFGGVGFSYSRPLHWEGKQWQNFGMLSSGTLLLSLTDESIDQWHQGFSEDIPNTIMVYGNKYGNPNNNYMLTGGVYLSGLLLKNEKLRRTGVLLLSSATAGGFLQQVSKRIVGRARPRSGETAYTFDPIHLDRVFEYDSFPSGHAMLAFSNAYAIAKQFESPWIKAGLYTVGMVPGMVRVLDRFHWISDVAFSTVLSIFIVESIDRYLDGKYNEKYVDHASRLQWNLTFAPSRLGIAVSF